MRVRDLIERLETMDQDAKVLIAEQPNWPFEYSIDGVVEVDLDQANEDGSYNDDELGMVVYLEEGEQLGYLSGAATEELGWR